MLPLDKMILLKYADETRHLEVLAQDGPLTIRSLVAGKFGLRAEHIDIPGGFNYTTLKTAKCTR